MTTPARRCTFLITGMRWGRHVVAQDRCRRRTTHPSERCWQHRRASV